jgi:hypothetical protein
VTQGVPSYRYQEEVRVGSGRVRRVQLPLHRRERYPGSGRARHPPHRPDRPLISQRIPSFGAASSAALSLCQTLLTRAWTTAMASTAMAKT